MPKTQNKKKKGKTNKLVFRRRLYALISTLLFLAFLYIGGSYLGLGANADTRNDLVYPPYAANPALAAGSCGQGLDIVMLIDASSSMGEGGLDKAKNVARSFVTAMQGTPMMFAIGRVAHEPDSDDREIFTQNTSAMISAINAVETGDSSAMHDLTWLTEQDPRPTRPNLIIVISDFQTTSDQSNVSVMKQRGTRMLALLYPTPGKTQQDVRAEAAYFSGPAETGNALTSDIILVTNLDALATDIKTYVQQLCAPPSPGTQSGPTGPVGPGPGPGMGIGPGTSPTSGAGGGGGSSATDQGDANNSTPSNSDQGDSTEQPKVEASPFFDGKLFAIGSDTKVGSTNTIGVGGYRFGYGWFYLLGGLILLGVSGWLGWRYRQRLRTVLGSIGRKLNPVK